MPARRNDAIWRLNTMRSAGFSFLGVISIWLKLLRSLTCTPARSRPMRSLRARVGLGASSTPVTVAPLGSVATYLYFGIVLLRRSRRCTRCGELRNGGDVVLDGGDGFVAQGSHALVDRQLAELVVRGACSTMSSFIVGADLEQLVHPDPIGITRVRAEVAARAVGEGLLRLPTPLLVRWRARRGSARSPRGTRRRCDARGVAPRPPMTDDATRNDSMPMSRKRCSAAVASVACNDESTKCPVSADCTAMRAVSTSRISPTRITSGS